ncbi:MAG TPA: LLM class F420-dependent oxidoreductase [Dehalococcoidia bacterium]|nr:LLM class F420-dependent oxidoreductase [Dehalococcoidia bacterium]HIM80499.1 LLM class F420-dependent oxidoreductase [Dehalococcoidia bacterium]
MPTTFGTSMPSRGDMASPENLRTLAQRAESLGFDSVWVSDHIILPRKVDSFYPYAADGVATFRPDEDYYDPLATLNFLAGCTQKIRLGTHVLILPYRNPVVTAKMLSTLDVLSGGRVILGAGVGWMEEEFQALGLDTYAQRGAVTDEYIQLFKELWTKDEPEFQGEHYQLSGMGFMPKPVQKPHPPIWIGGHTNPAIRRAAEYGDGWMPIGLRPPAILEPEELAEKIARLRRLTVRAGRPEDAVSLCFSTGVTFDDSPGATRRMMSGRAEQIATDLRQYQDLGVRNFILGFPGDSVAALDEAMEQFSKQVMPLIPQD